MLTLPMLIKNKHRMLTNKEVKKQKKSSISKTISSILKSKLAKSPKRQ